MKTKISNLKKLIGNTPLVQIKYKYLGKIRNAYFKLEYYNLTGSAKDRVALSILTNALLDGSLKPNQTIVETTSGNMGISFSAIGSYLGHKVVIFMPKHLSDERKALLKLYGAELHLTNDFNEAFVKAKEYAKTHNAYLTKQFDNIYNVQAHYTTTAVEIAQVVPSPKYFLAGVGTAGTLMGVGSYLKNKYGTKVIALEPLSSKILSLGVSLGHHKLQGLSDEIVPSIYDPSLVDSIVSVADNDAIAMAQKLARELGLGVGISSGANFVGCVLTGKNNVISVFTDDNKKYLSCDLVKPTQSHLVDNIELLGMKVLKCC